MKILVMVIEGYSLVAGRRNWLEKKKGISRREKQPTFQKDLQERGESHAGSTCWEKRSAFGARGHSPESTAEPVSQIPPVPGSLYLLGLIIP